jgi:hypothetical protein
MQQSASNNGSVDESSEPRDWPGDRYPTRWDVHDANKLPETRFLQRFKTALLHSEDALNCKQLMTQLGHDNDDPSLLVSRFGEAAGSVSAETTRPLIPFHCIKSADQSSVGFVRQTIYIPDDPFFPIFHPFHPKIKESACTFHFSAHSSSTSTSKPSLFRIH